MLDMFVYETEFSFMIAVRNESHAYYIFWKIRTYDNVFYFSVRVSSSFAVKNLFHCMTLNVYKSYGSDTLHQRILKELQNKIALPCIKLIFEWSLRTNTLPENWKLGNITPIFKNSNKVV